MSEVSEQASESGDDEQTTTSSRDESLTPEQLRAQNEELRREVVKHRRDARAAQATADTERREREQLRLAHESEQERAIREAVEAERVKLTTEFAGERLHNRLRIRAAGKLRDPEDAVLHLAGSLNGDADDAVVDEAIAALIKERDYLASPTNGGSLTDGGLVTQGARSTPPRTTGDASPDDWIRSQRRKA